MLLSAIRHYLHGSEAPPLSFRWTGAYRPADLPDRARGATQVLMQNVVGDSLGVETAATLASAIGVSYVCPCPSAVPLPALPRTVAPAPPPGLFYFPVGKHGFLLANDADLAAARAVREQAAHFLGTYFESGAAMIVDPFASR
jgi:hypothetical protein